MQYCLAPQIIGWKEVRQKRK